MSRPNFQSKNPNTRRFWDRLIIDSQKKLFSSSIYIHKNKIVVNYLKNKSGYLLDVGIGYGYLEKALENEKSKLSFYGVDISRKAIKNLSKEITGDFRVGTISKIPFSNNFFDHIVVLDVLEHIDKKDSNKAYSEIYRVLKSGGNLIVSVPLNDTAQDKIKNGHVRDYTPEIIIREVNKNGFKVKKTKLLFAFRNMYFIKTFFVNMLPVLVKKPNLIVIFAQKQ